MRDPSSQAAQNRFDHKLRRAVVVPYLLGTIFTAWMANTSAWSEQFDRMDLHLLAAAGVASSLLIYLFPWHKFSRNLFTIIIASTICLIAVAVFVTGGGASPYDEYYLLVVIFAGLYYQRRAALLVAIVVFVFGLAPVLYSTPPREFVLRHAVLGTSYLLIVWVQNLIIHELVRQERDRRGLQDDLTEGMYLRDELARANALLAQQATTDVLTGLPNHRALVARLDEEVERAHRHGRPLAVLFMDVDHFKQINDTHGHQAGDSALEQTARIAVQSVRTIDTVGRYGGEEFVALLPETDLERAIQVAERLRSTIAAHEFAIPGDASMHITTSVGVAVCHGAECQRPEVIRAADAALYSAKRDGRN
nr:GGDEF domain-containing protein [Chloroflexota bacterium]